MNKKILVSDYDDTLNNGEEYIRLNIDAIKDFRAKGNIFVIATGRAYNSLKNTMEKDYKDVEYDYLVTNHGAAIFDKNDKLIKSTNFKRNTELKILELLNTDNIQQTIKYTEREEVIDSSRYNKILYSYKERDVAILDCLNIKKEKIVKAYNILRLGKTPKIEIINRRINKSKAIKEIQKIEKTDNVYVIGDAYQDIEMIKKYNGYCVDNAIEDIKKISKKQYKAVYELINEIK